MISQTVEQLEQDLERLAAEFGRTIPQALQQCEPLLLDNFLENFARESDPDGNPWPPRKKIGDGHPLLVETQTEGSGSLMAAATGQAGGHVSRIDDNTLVVGVDKDGGIGGIPGAGVHNYGYPEKNIPQREFLGISEDTAAACGNVIADVLWTEFF